MSDGDPKERWTVGVIGAGTMGVGAAHDLVLHRLSAVLVDVSDAVLERARGEIARLASHTSGLLASQPCQPGGTGDAEG